MSTHQTTPTVGLSSVANEKRDAVEAVERPIMDLPLPTFVKPVYNWLVGNMIFQDDEFVQVVRKFSCLVAFLSGMLELCLTGFHLYMYYTLGYMGDLYIAVGFFLCGWVYLGVFQYVRIQKYGSDSVVALVMVNASFTMTCCHFLTTNYDTPLLDIAAILCAIVVQSPYVGLSVVYHLLLILHGYHTFKYLPEAISYNGGGGTFLLLVPGVRLTTGLEPFLFSIAVSFPVIVLAVVAVWFSGQEQIRQVAVAKKSVLLTDSVVGHLRKYNTDSVLDLLSDAKDDKESNTQLLCAFQALVGNLERYRPFLPNYLFLSDTDEEGPSGAGDGGEDEATERDQQTLHEEDTTSVSVDNSTSFSDHSNSGSNMSNSYNVRRGPSIRNDQSIATGNGGPSSGTHYRGVVACAWLELKCNEWFSFQLSNKTELNQRHNLKSFTDTMFGIAHISKASIHSMVGDRVQLSWNATHRVLQPESKAATFLLKLRTALAAKMPESHTLAAACCSGAAEIHSIFSSATKQQALYIDAPWVPLLGCCYALATKHQALIIDSATAAGAQFEVEAQGVDCIRYKPRAAVLDDGVTIASSVGVHSKHSPVVSASYSGAAFVGVGGGGEYESLVSNLGHVPLQSKAAVGFSSNSATPKSESGKKPSSVTTLALSFAFELLRLKMLGDDEWMYQVNEGENNSATMTTAALQHAVEGHFGEAVEALEKAEEEMASSKRCLREGDGQCEDVEPEPRGTHSLKSLREELTEFCHAGLRGKGSK